MSHYGNVPGSTFKDAKRRNGRGQTLTWALKRLADSVGDGGVSRSVAERRARWRASQTPYFRARVNISTQIVVPPLNASVSVSAAVRAASLNYVG
ncbi:MAG: hypothetical protein OXI70_14090, partial [Chloroflexota bacterium]|nr:hypothetical protein [Chloroflexota bacterium]